MTIKLGCLGDSGTDDYTVDGTLGGVYAAITFNWLELLVRLRSVDAGTFGSYAEPRRNGYAYNWARRAAQSGTMLTQGQHTGLAAQVASGAVDYVSLWIGSNDFQGAGAGGRFDVDAIYDGTGSSPQTYADAITDDIVTAIDAILAEGPSGMIVSNYSWFDEDLQVHANWPDPTGIARIEAVIDAVNATLVPEIRSRGLALFDYRGLFRTMGALRAGGNTFPYWNVTVDDSTTGNDPLHFRLGDNAHYSTIVNWWIAAEIVRGLNERYGQILRPLGPWEVLNYIGTGGTTGSLRRST